MRYNPMITVCKMIPPTLVPVVVETARNLNPQDIDRDLSYLIGMIVLTAFYGMKNVMKNMWRKR